MVIYVYRHSQAQEHRIAVIAQNNVEVARIDLDTVEQPGEIKLPGKFDETIQFEKGRIRFKDADCPDKLCVKSGWLTEIGDIAVCLPNKAIVFIRSTIKS